VEVQLRQKQSSKPFSDRSNNQNKHPTQTSRKPAQRRIRAKTRTWTESTDDEEQGQQETATKAVQVVASNHPKNQKITENAQQQDPPRHQDGESLTGISVITNTTAKTL
jgi:hypothetical protein